MTEKTETGWLIEGKSPDGGRPQWFSAGREFHWTTDASKAIRFSRRQDAETFAEWCTISAWPDVTVTEHRWG